MDGCSGSVMRVISWMQWGSVVLSLRRRNGNFDWDGLASGIGFGQQQRVSSKAVAYSASLYLVVKIVLDEWNDSSLCNFPLQQLLADPRFLVFAVAFQVPATGSVRGTRKARSGSSTKFCRLLFHRVTH